MNLTSRSVPFIRRHSAFWRTLVPAALLLLVSSNAFAQNTSGTNDADRKRRGSSDDNGGRRSFNPEDMQARLLSSLRERLDVTDDEEWKLISDRITKVNELRRNAPGGFGVIAAFAGRSSQSGSDSRSSRSSRGGSGEIAALQSAIKDKLPDAEIKARLDRVRQARKDNEAKLSKAQEDLRALLTVRQEAVAVMFGLLP